MSSERDLHKPMGVNPAANNYNNILNESSKSQIEIRPKNNKNNHLSAVDSELRPIGEKKGRKEVCSSK